jgi:hypothetical protein
MQCKLSQFRTFDATAEGTRDWAMNRFNAPRYFDGGSCLALTFAWLLELRSVFRPKAWDNLAQGNALGFRRTGHRRFQAEGLGQRLSQAFGLALVYSAICPQGVALG